MKTFDIEIKEVLSIMISIEAENPHDAVLKTKEMYRNEEIVLDSQDYVLTEIAEFKNDSIINEEILSNGNNFYIIDKDYIHFWGLDIKSHIHKIDEKIKGFISAKDFSLNEVCEFNQIEDFELFRLFY